MYFDKNSPEYVSNGHYKIGELEYMSVWTYKKIYRYGFNNSTEENYLTTIKMDAKYGLYNAKCEMETGYMKGEYVQLHSLKDLKDFMPKMKITIKR